MALKLNPPTSQPALVTGATGFIGRHLVDRLLEQGRRVVCLVRGLEAAESLRQSGAHLIVGDVCHASDVKRALEESQATDVFHLAGCVRARRVSDFMRVNRDGVDAIAAGCASLTRPPVLIVVSSLAACGPSAPGQPHVESDPPSPVSEYGRSKLAGERVAATYAAAVPITVVRPPVVYGPGDRSLLEVFRTIERRGLHLLPGAARGNTPHLSVVHVHDLVEGIVRAQSCGARLQQNGTPDQGVYFLGADDHPSYAELGLAIALALGRIPPAVVRIPAPLLKAIAIVAHAAVLLGRRPGWINRDKVCEALAGSWTCASDKARVQLGWSPDTTLADGLLETACWYRRAGWL